MEEITLAHQKASASQLAALEDAIKIIAAFVWNAQLKSVVSAVDPAPRLNFWRVIHGNFLDMAVIEWCKLFGADDNEKQPVHWKNVIAAENHDRFRSGLQGALGITWDDWVAYWKKFKEYRDKHAAHHDKRYLDPTTNQKYYPNLAWALEAAYFYYEQILATNRIPASRYPEDIRDYCRRFSEQAREVATEAIGATAHRREKVR